VGDLENPLGSIKVKWLRTKSEGLFDSELEGLAQLRSQSLIGKKRETNTGTRSRVTDAFVG
jgi:hypothetical protein